MFCHKRIHHKSHKTKHLNLQIYFDCLRLSRPEPQRGSRIEKAAWLERIFTATLPLHSITIHVEILYDLVHLIDTQQYATSNSFKNKLESSQ